MNPIEKLRAALSDQEITDNNSTEARVINWDLVLLDIDPSPCSKCPPSESLSCCGCREQLKYEERLEYSKCVGKLNVSNTYIGLLATFRKIDEQLVEAYKEIENMVKNNDVPEEVLNKYLESALKDCKIFNLLTK